LLLIASVKLVLKKHGITEGVLVIDESDRTCCKQTRRIYKAHKLKNKATGGYDHSQSIVLLLFFTNKLHFLLVLVFTCQILSYQFGKKKINVY